MNYRRIQKARTATCPPETALAGGAQKRTPKGSNSVCGRHLGNGVCSGVHSMVAILLFCFWCGVSATGTTNLAVIDFEADAVSEGEARTLCNKLRIELVKLGEYTVVERGQMGRILEEQGFQQSGCTSTECAVEMGQLLGVKRIVAGSVGRVGSTYFLAARVIDVETGKIVLTASREARGTVDLLLTREVEILARELSGHDVGDLIAVSSTPVAFELYLENDAPDGLIVFLIVRGKDSGKKYLDKAWPSDSVPPQVTVDGVTDSHVMITGWLRKVHTSSGKISDTHQTSITMNAFESKGLRLAVTDDGVSGSGSIARW